MNHTHTPLCVPYVVATYLHDVPTLLSILVGCDYNGGNVARSLLLISASQKAWVHLRVGRQDAAACVSQTRR